MSVSVTGQSFGEGLSWRKCCPRESQHWEDQLATIELDVSMHSSVNTQPFIFIIETQHNLATRVFPEPGQDWNSRAPGCGDRAATVDVHREAAAAEGSPPELAQRDLCFQRSFLTAVGAMAG